MLSTDEPGGSQSCILGSELGASGLGDILMSHPGGLANIKEIYLVRGGGRDHLDIPSSIQLDGE